MKPLFNIYMDVTNVFACVHFGKLFKCNIASSVSAIITHVSFSRAIEQPEPLFKTFNLLEFNNIYTLKLMKCFFFRISNDS